MSHRSDVVSLLSHPIRCQAILFCPITGNTPLTSGWRVSAKLPSCAVSPFSLSLTSTPWRITLKLCSSLTFQLIHLAISVWVHIFLLYPMGLRQEGRGQGTTLKEWHSPWEKLDTTQTGCYHCPLPGRCPPRPIQAPTAHAPHPYTHRDLSHFMALGEEGRRKGVWVFRAIIP